MSRGSSEDGGAALDGSPADRDSLRVLEEEPTEDEKRAKIELITKINAEA